MFLAIVYETYPGLEIFPTLLIPELSYMPPCLLLPHTVFPRLKKHLFPVHVHQIHPPGNKGRIFVCE